MPSAEPMTDARPKKLAKLSLKGEHTRVAAIVTSVPGTHPLLLNQAESRGRQRRA